MAIQIRSATRGDAAAIATVHVASWRAGYAGAIPEPVLSSDEFESSRRSMWTEWRFNPTQRVTLAVTDEDDVTGFAAYGPERERSQGFTGRGELYSLYVHPEWWGHGIASELIEHATERLRAEGFSQAVLWVLKSNQRARGFYERRGWVATGHADEFVVTARLKVPEVEYHRVLS